jgi:hypothetical protein
MGLVQPTPPASNLSANKPFEDIFHECIIHAKAWATQGEYSTHQISAGPVFIADYPLPTISTRA